MEHKKVNFLHSVRLKMLLAMAFFAFVTGGFACALFISSTKEEIGSVTRGYMRDLSELMALCWTMSWTRMVTTRFPASIWLRYLQAFRWKESKAATYM